MMCDPVFILSNITKPFKVQIDASDFTLGGVLAQEGHSIVFESCKLSKAERKYAAQEKELLAVIY